MDLINYYKPKNEIAEISLKLKKEKENLKLDGRFSEDKNFISINGIQFQKDNFFTLDKIIVKTFNNGINNNDFSLKYGKNIKIEGTKFDANNLSKYFNLKSDSNNLRGVNKDIEIDILNISVPLSEQLKNFKLIGRIDNGKFSKISAKGDFGNNNFLIFL